VLNVRQKQARPKRPRLFLFAHHTASCGSLTEISPKASPASHAFTSLFAYSHCYADLDSMADFFESTLAGIRMAAKAGKSRHALRNIAAFASRTYMASDRRITPE